MISLAGVEKSFGDFKVLRGIDLEVKEGERLTVIGPGGSGKSLILKIILGLIKPDSGTVQLLGKDMVESDELQKQEVLSQVGMAFQQGALFDFMTVRENLEFAMEHCGNASNLSKEDRDETIKSLLAEIKLPHTEAMFPHELSGGMQRRVGIARALAVNPCLAIFDEPTSGLDPVTSTISLNMIKDLTSSKEKTTLVIATSAVEIAMRFAPRIVVINEGKVVADDDWKVLLVSGPKWVKHFLGVRLIGLDKEYVEGLDLPKEFIAEHW